MIFDEFLEIVTELLALWKGKTLDVDWIYGFFRGAQVRSQGT